MCAALWRCWWNVVSTDKIVESEWTAKNVPFWQVLFDFAITKEKSNLYNLELPNTSINVFDNVQFIMK